MADQRWSDEDRPGDDMSNDATQMAESESRTRSVKSDLVEIAADLWRYRELLYELTRRDVRIRYKQAVMGFAWAVFMPTVIVLAGLLVRYAMAHVSGSQLDGRAVAGVAVKALPWAFFVGAIGFATPSLTSNANLVTKVYLPREVFPLTAMLVQAFDTGMGTIPLLILLPFLGVGAAASLLWVPVLAGLLFLFTAAVALLLSCANLFFRDVKYIVQVLLTFGIFLTPVFFEPAMFGARANLLMLNPLTPLLEGIRLAVVERHNLLVPFSVTSGAHVLTIWTPAYLGYAALWAVGGLVGCAVLFRRLDFLFAEYI